MKDSPSLEHHLNNENSYKPFRGLKRRVFFKHIQREMGTNRSMKVVEFGSGIGTNRRLLQRKADHWQEVEVNPELVTYSQETDADGTFVCGDALEHLSSLMADSIDVVLGFNSIDQFSLDQAETLIAAAHRALKPGGVFMHLTDQSQASRLAYSYFKQHQTGTTRWLCEPIPAGLKCGALISGSRNQMKQIEKKFRSRILDISPDGKKITDITPDDAIVYKGALDEAIEACHQNGLGVFDPNGVQSQAIYSLAEAQFGAATSDIYTVGPKLSLADSKEDPPVLTGGEDNEYVGRRLSSRVINILLWSRKIHPNLQLRLYSALIDSAVKT